MARTDVDREYDYYPAFLDLVRKHVVVVGGGEIATGKVRGLLPCGVDPLVVIAPDVSPLIAACAASGSLTWHARPYRDGDLAGADLAFAATDDRAANAVVAHEARERGIPVLAVDDIPNCDFIAPAVVKRDHLIVAISTGGHSPAMASHLRRRLERVISPEWGDLLAVAAAVRQRLGPDRARVSPLAWQAALDREVKRLVWAGELEAATTLLYERLAPVAVAP
jgi:siroheme synthase-like protein